MPNRFDASGKQLVVDPNDWFPLVGLPPVPAGEVEPIRLDTDLSTVTRSVDRLFRISTPDPWIIHFEIQSGPDPLMDLRALLYNVLARWQYRLPVATVVILLRPEAFRPTITGRILDALAPDCSLAFRYRVVRVWELPVDRALTGGVSILPLAPLCAAPEADLEAILREVWRRLERELPPGEAGDAWRTTYILSGLRLPEAAVKSLMDRIHMLDLRDSSTYQAILAEGRAEGIAQGKAEGVAQGKAEGVAQGKAEGVAQGKAEGVAQGKAEGRADALRSIVLRLGERKFGPPVPAALEALRAVTDVRRLEDLGERLLDAVDWEQLLRG